MHNFGRPSITFSFRGKKQVTVLCHLLYGAFWTFSLVSARATVAIATTVARHHRSVISAGIRPSVGEMTVSQHLSRAAIYCTRSRVVFFLCSAQSRMSPALLRIEITLNPRARMLHCVRFGDNRVAKPNTGETYVRILAKVIVSPSIGI
jgi:hypothetical protein